MMIKKLAVPALMLAMAAFGCSSSTTPSGTGGSAGHATGGTGTGGTHLGGASGGGTSGGGTSGGGTSGGGTSGGGHPGGGTSGGGTSGGGHAGGGTSGGGAGGGVQVMTATCTTTDSAATATLSAADFCTNLLANCANPPSGYADMTTCMTTYAAGAAAKKGCQSYHLCWGVEGIGNATTPHGDPTTHCPHAEGVAVCTQTQ